MKKITTDTKPFFPKIVPSSETATLSSNSYYKTAKISFHWTNDEFTSEHSHDFWELTLIISGTIKHTVNEHEFIQSAGDCTLLRPEDRHKMNFIKKSQKNFLYLNFGFNRNIAKMLFDLHCGYSAVLEYKSPLVFSLPENKVDEIYNKALFAQGMSQENYEKMTLIITNQILLRFFEHKLSYNDSFPTWMNALITFIKNPSNFELSVEDIIKTTPYEHSQLSKLFKKYMGITLKEYIIEEKLVYAKTLLSSTNLSILAISNKIGYCSLSSFNHLFMKKYNMTPTAYRKNNKI